MRMPKQMLRKATALAFAAALTLVGPGPVWPTSGAQAAAVLGSPARADPIKYTVKPGDTLSGIADSFGIKVSAIQDANALPDPNALRAGMVLSIPGDSAPPVQIPADAKYTVKPGDSLLTIAQTMGVSASALQQANGLQDPNALQAGQVLTIPGGVQTTGSAAPSQPPPTPSPSLDTKYTVKPGDTLSGISLSFAVGASAILEANGIQDPNSLKIGQVLTIPGGARAGAAPVTSQPAASPTPTPASPTKYTVKPGDTLSGIAASFAVKASVLQESNGIQDPNSLKAGQVLSIPGETTQAPAPTQVPPSPSPAPAATPSPTPPTSAAPGGQPSPTAQPTPTAPTGDPRLFEQTGFRIDNDRFWDFFSRRGGVRTFGYPVSKEFQLFGFRVQLFQRAIMQLKPDGSASLMNLLEEGLMPFNRINFSTFPVAAGAMASEAPKPGTERYFDKLLDFVKAKSPDQWNDLPVGFHKTFNATVRYEEAYPDKKQDPGIMPAINLELWGVPTSPPTFDPSNRNFVYLRFQRGIMHYDKTTGTTQGLLLGDYLKSIITGVNLPPDLEEQARSSPFYRQYNPLSDNGLNRPKELPGTTMRGAFARDGLVVLDPGHGGTQVGAAYLFPGGAVLVEKDVNLKLSMKVADLLRKAGRQVMLTRTADTQVNNPPRDVTGNGKMSLDDDLEARIDVANNSGAALFLSIHFNGNSNTALRGAEVYYNGKRPFADKNRKFAQMVLDNLIASTKAAGFNLPNRGIKLDEAAVGKGNAFYLLGPTDDDRPRATQMVGALAEGAFLTNDQDAEMVRQDRFLDAVAAGYAQAIQQWFQSIDR